MALAQFRPSSENRRILRKGQDLAATLIPRAQFDYTPKRRDLYKTYADAKFGKEVMSYERLDALFQGRIISHLLLFTDARTGAELGTVTLYLEPPAMAYYYYAFYDLAYFSRNLGMFMMTWAVAEFARRGFRFLYLGSCYRQSALYKTQFSGAEFFNGLRWSANLQEAQIPHCPGGIPTRPALAGSRGIPAVLLRRRLARPRCPQPLWGQHQVTNVVTPQFTRIRAQVSRVECRGNEVPPLAPRCGSQVFPNGRVS